MTQKFIRIAGFENIATYDDGDQSSAIETDHTIIASNFEAPGGSGASGSITVLTALQAGGGGAIGIQYKHRTLTYSSGILTSSGTESGWVDV